MINLKFIYFTIALLLPLSINGQEINKMKRQFDIKLPPIKDSASVNSDKEYEEWLRNEPLKMDSPSYKFHDYYHHEYNQYNLLNQAPPKPTFKLNRSSIFGGTGNYSLAPNFNVIMGSATNDIHGLLQSHSADFSLIYHKDNFTISGGASVGKYQNFIWNSNVFSFHANAEYQVNNWLALGLQGSFVPNVKNIGPVSPFTSTNSYGGYAKIKINSWLAIIPSISRYFDAVSHKWITAFNIMPAINIGNLLHLKSKNKIQQKEKLKKVLENY